MNIFFHLRAAAIAIQTFNDLLLRQWQRRWQAGRPGVTLAS
jgi:hypothetical protein